MTAVNRLSLLLTCLLLAAGAIRADVKHINVADGLSSRQVYEVEEDADGFIWIYTNHGMDRFDGHTMKHYPLTDSEEANDHILSATSMRRSRDGEVWVALKSGVIYRYDRMLDAFVKAIVFNPANQLRLYNFIFDADGSVLICSDNGVWHSTDGGSPRPLALQGVFTDAICSDGSGGFYVGSDKGVYHLRGEEVQPVKGTEHIYVKSLEVAGGKLFIGSFDRGVTVFDPSQQSLGQLPFDIPPIPVNAMYRWSGDSLLIGVDGAGVFLVNARSGRLLHHYRDDIPGSEVLSGNTITDVLVDRNDGLWISTSHNGLNYLPPYSRSVQYIRSRPGKDPTLSSDNVNVIYQDPDGDYWIGTDKGVCYYNPSTGTWRDYLHSDGYNASVVLAINSDQHGRIWTGSYGDGVSIIDKRSGRVERFAPGGRTPVSYVFAIHTDSHGSVWVGGIDGLLTRFDPATGSLRQYDADCIAVLMTDTDGSLLIGGNKGVGRYIESSDSIEWKMQFDTVAIRNQAPVRSLSSGPDGELWISTTGDGLIRYDRITDTARRYTTADGFDSNTIYAAIPDRSGNIWITTETDLYRLDPATGRLSRFTHYLGLERGAFNPGAALLASDGKVMLGVADGWVFFDPDEVSGDTAEGEILLTDFRLHDRSVETGAAGSPLKCNINLTDAIHLSSDQNSIEVGFTMIDYVSPQRVTFEYMLDGYDKGFIAAGYHHSVRYNNLPPGSYTFRLRAIDSYNGSLIAERTLPIFIAPPAWQTWWAKLIYTLVGLVLVYLAVRYFRMKTNERRIESQIESFAAIAHDIRTPMSLIKDPLQNIEADTALSDGSRSNLSQVRTGIDRTMSLLSEMLELRHTNHRSLSLSRCDIREYLNMKVEDFRMLAVFKGLAIECKVADDMPRHVLIDADILDHILDNLISNAIKYTQEGTVTISARRLRFWRWQITVSDTGIGISKADARHIFHRRHRSAGAESHDAAGMGMGLLITRRLVSSHHGAISFESEPGRGSTFSVTLPLRYGRHLFKSSKTLVGPVLRHDRQSAADTPEADGRSNIFVVEDDPDMLAYLCDCLSPEYNVTPFSDPMQVLEKARTESPDLIITDVMMPRLRGDELCRLIKSDIDTSHILVMLLTGLAGRADILSGFESNADEYVVKPFDVIVLKARIRNIIKSRRQLGRRVLAEDGEPAKEDFTSELDREFMTKVMDSINAHMSDSDFAVADLCADLGMSRSTVYNKIKSLSGQSVNEFIRIMRLNRAKELLATRRYNISEVAYMVGFSDPKYFSTCFKKQFGISPSKA